MNSTVDFLSKQKVAFFSQNFWRKLKCSRVINKSNKSFSLLDRLIIGRGKGLRIVVSIKIVENIVFKECLLSYDR
jgi:hypothetical protein